MYTRGECRRQLIEVEDRAGGCSRPARAAGGRVRRALGALGRVLARTWSPRTTSRASTTRRWTASPSAPPTPPRAGPGRSRPRRGVARGAHPAAGAARQGQAIAISTGAMLPEGADAVVRVEDTAPVDGAVEARVAAEPGRDVRRAGEDVGAGSTVLRAGTAHRPGRARRPGLGGRRGGACTRRSAAAVLTTGDELLGPGEPRGPGEVRDTNRVGVALVSRSTRAPRSRLRPASPTSPRPRRGAARRPGRRCRRRLRRRLGGDPRPRPARARGARRRGGLLGVALRPGSRPGSARAGTRSCSGSRATRSRRWSRSSCSCGPRCSRSPARTSHAPWPRRPSTRPTRRRRAARTPYAARCRCASTAARASHRAAGLARAQLDARSAGAGDDPERRDRGARGGARVDRVAARMEPGVSVAAQQIAVEVRLFAMLREGARGGGSRAALAAGATAGDRSHALAHLGGLAGLVELLGRRSVDGRQPRVRRAATVLQEGDELALIPPVSGGADGAVHASVSAEPLSAQRSERARRRSARRRDRRLPGRHPRDPGARLRGLCRDGGRADRVDPARLRRRATGCARRPRSTGPAASRAASRASSSRSRRRTARKRSPGRARRSTRSRRRRRSGSASGRGRGRRVGAGGRARAAGGTEQR